MKHFQFLDILRGLAILWVICVHFSYIGIDTPHWFEIGKIGVPMFFMLSCYTLCLSQSQRTEHSRMAFFTRRFFRIYPLFFLLVTYSLILQLCEMKFGRGKFDSYSVFTYFTKYSFTYWFFPDEMNRLFLWEWSLFNEIIFYSIFPFL